MKNYIKKYEPIGGIEHCYNLYKTNEMTLNQLGKKVGVSGTTVSNDLKKNYGKNIIKILAKEKKIENNIINILNKIEKRVTIDIPYKTIVQMLEQKLIPKNYFTIPMETILKTCSEIIEYPPKTIRVKNKSISQISDESDTVNIRYGVAKKGIAEFKIGMYRFKISYNKIKNSKANLFCIKSSQNIVYYLIPSEELFNIQSLNLKFENVTTELKYTPFLIKTESPCNEK